MDNKRFFGKTEKGLNGGVEFILICPLHVEAGDEWKEGGASNGEISPVWRAFGVWRMARWEVVRGAPVMAV